MTTQYLKLPLPKLMIDNSNVSHSESNVNVENVQLPFGLKAFCFTSKELKTEDGALVQRLIKAKTKESAWGKFATQYFGALKPAPSDWIVLEVKI